MMWELLLEGYAAGLLIAMPMGAIGVLCLRIILVQGKIPGLMAGFGIALADGLAAFISAIGLTVITNFIKDHDNWMRIIGASILIGFGLYLLLTNKKPPKKRAEKGLYHIVFFMFLITFTNPLTILSFLGIFASFGLESLENNFPAAFLLSSAVFVGSMSWWAALTLATCFFHVTEKLAKIVNEVAGSLLILIGLSSLFLY